MIDQKLLVVMWLYGKNTMHMLVKLLKWYTVYGKSIFSQEDIFAIAPALPNMRQFNFVIFTFMLHKPIAKGYFREFLISQFLVHSRNW